MKMLIAIRWCAVGVCLCCISSFAFATATQPVQMKMTREPLGKSDISPMQYGQFIEYLCDLVPGMWAEKLYDGSFEGLSPYKFVYLKETDFKEKPWYPIGATNRATLDDDRESKVGGEMSRRIEVKQGPPCVVGISQDGIWAKKAEAMRFSCYLRAKGIQSKVRVYLHRDGKTFGTGEFEPNGDWTKFSLLVGSLESLENATITIEFRGPGTLWIDSASLMPLDTVGGWRKDVVEAVKALNPGVIRFGGSAVDVADMGAFEWKDTIGDPDRRKPLRAWGGLQQAGAGLEEIVKFCHAVHAEPLICVRFNQRTAKDAADEVEYFNGSQQTPMGALRKRNGHTEPYGVKYWQIGNEIASKEYDTHAADFARAMKAVDPSIEILSSFPTPAVLSSAGQWIDYVCPHQYSRDLAAMAQDLKNVSKMITANQPAGRNIRIGITEWNTTAGDAGPARAMLWNLENALACSRYHNLLHRNSDWVTIANRSNLCNSFCSGIIQTDHRGRLYKTPTYYAQELYANLAAKRAMKVQCNDDQGLDVSATASGIDSSAEAVVFVVNPTLRDVHSELDFSDYGIAERTAMVTTLADRIQTGEPDAANSFDDPQRIGLTETLVTCAPGGKFSYHFPALTLTVLKVPPK